MSNSLEKTSNVAVIIVSCAVLISIVQTYRSNSVQTTSGVTVYKQGDDISRAVKVDFSKADRTILLAIRSDCKYCSASVPFYRRVVDRRKASANKVQLVAAIWKNDVDADEYLRSKQLTFDSTVTLDEASLNISATPTLILADRAGKVMNMWVGRLPAEREREVLDAVP